MLKVRLAGAHLYGKQLFTWLSLVVSLVSFFPLDVLDEIWDIIESVSEGFLTYSFMINRILHSWSFYMKLMKLAEGSFHKFHIKWPLV